MEWKPDKHAEQPVYKQIAAHLEHEIVSGALPPGAPLPPERTLARQYGVNRGTVSAAYEELRAAGLIQSLQGSGTWVSRHLWGVQKVPNWHQYTTGGAFLPALPIVRRIREAGWNPAIINLAKADLATAMLPTLGFERLPGGKLDAIELGYVHPKGEQHLREAVSAHLRTHYGIAVSPEEILITSGAQQALHLISLCLLAPGDAVAMEGPSYTYSLPLFASAGLRLYRLPMDADGVIPDEMRTLYKKHRIRMVFLNPTFHNPTGTVLSESRRRQLLAVCRELRIPVVEDDAYGALALDGAKRPPLPLKALDTGDSVLYVGSLSKTIASGLRIGWLAGPRAVIERLADAKQQMDYGTSSVSQQLARLALEGGLWERQMERLRPFLTAQRDRMLAALDTHLRKEASWNVPAGSCHIWCRLNTPVDGRDLLEAAIRAGVVMTPGEVFGAEPGWMRLTYSWESSEALEEGIRRLAEAIKMAEPGRKRTGSVWRSPVRDG
nr:PLP-dependent aminotransferase family protein [Brevibacillus thermoruber]